MLMVCYAALLRVSEYRLQLGYNPPGCLAGNGNGRKEREREREKKKVRAHIILIYVHLVVAFVGCLCCFSLWLGSCFAYIAICICNKQHINGLTCHRPYTVP